jgi:hypothetical protein
MNYKIRITAENQAIVKRIADENNMNNGEEYHYYIGYYLITDGNKIRNFAQQANFQEITTEQFIELFDKKESLVGRWFQALEDNAAGAPTIKNSYYQIKEGHQEGFLFLVPTFSDPNFLFGLSKEQENKHFKLMPKDFQPTQETELDKWLKETKAKNLSLEELRDETCFLDTKFYNQVRKELKVVGTLYQHLFNLWNNPEESPKVETEWQPKRGDRVLVWDDSEKNASELIFVTKIEGHNTPIVVVTPMCEKNFLEGKGFDTIEYQHMKPLPIEQQTEDKVEVASEIYAEQNAKDDNISYHNLFSPLKYAFINGAKWQSEQPIETNFKSKVIDYLEDNTNFNEDRAKEYIERDIIEVALKHKLAANHNKLILEKIKQL